MAEDASLRDKTAIVGVGYTEFSKNSGKTTLGLALEAGYKAIVDAGLVGIGGTLEYLGAHLNHHDAGTVSAKAQRQTSAIEPATDDDRIVARRHC